MFLNVLYALYILYVLDVLDVLYALYVLYVLYVLHVLYVFRCLGCNFLKKYDTHSHSASPSLVRRGRRSSTGYLKIGQVTDRHPTRLLTLPKHL